MVSEDVMELKGTKVTVVGLARSGVAAARLLQAVGAVSPLPTRKSGANWAGADAVDESQMLASRSEAGTKRRWIPPNWWSSAPECPIAWRRWNGCGGGA